MTTPPLWRGTATDGGAGGGGTGLLEGAGVVEGPAAAAIGCMAVPFSWMSYSPELFRTAPLLKNSVLKLLAVAWVMVPALFKVPLRTRLPVPLRVMKPVGRLVRRRPWR